MSSAKEFFCQIPQAEREIRTILLQRDHYMALATSCTAPTDAMPSVKGMHKSQVESAALELSRLSDELGERLSAYVDQCKTVQAVIDALPKPRHKEVLTLRYICGLKWETIAERMGYADTRSIYKLHGWALSAAESYISARSTAV